MNARMMFATLFGVAMLAMGGGVAHANLLSIDNHSFETPVLADGGFTSSSIPGWSGAVNAGVFNPHTVAWTSEAPDGSNVAYLNNNTAAMAETPPHLQRYMLQDYCLNRGITCSFELFELETLDYLPTLQHIVGELRCNVVLYSVFSLPENASDRTAIFDSAEENGVVMCFVNEDLLVSTREDRAKIEELFDHKKTQPLDIVCSLRLDYRVGLQ